jgi:uncharacterized phage protein gp47/JayE
MPTPQTTLAALQLATPALPAGTTTLSIDSSVLPVVIAADQNTTRIELSLYNAVLPVTAFTTAAGQNTFSASVGIDQTVAESTVQIIGRNYNPTTAWLPSQSFALNFNFADPNGNVQTAIRAGVSGSLQPAWGASLPAAISNVSLASNILAVTCANTLQPGNQVQLSGVTGAAFLNGQVLTVVTNNSSEFTATFIHADYSSAGDTGTANMVTADSGVLWANVGFIAITPTIKFVLLSFESGLSIVIAPPSGITAAKNQTDCLLQWVTPDFPGFVGVRVMVSTDPAGINPPFTQFGDLVSSVSSTEQVVVNSQVNTQTSVPTAVVSNIVIDNNEVTVTAANSFIRGTVLTLAGLMNATFLNGQTLTVDTSSGTQFTARYVHSGSYAQPDSGTASSTISTNVVTDTQTVQLVNFSSVDIPSSLINSGVFYAMFSTVVQAVDQGSNVLYESVQNGPLLCGYVNLQVVGPADFPVLARKEEIAGRLIGQITRQRPTLDLSPRSEIRDLFIDPFSIEVSNMSVREWFAGVGSSISAISQVDDTTGTGVSDPFQSSPYKQQLARAYGLSPQDTQSLIDERFDILGEQAGLTRLAASSSTVVLTFYTYQQPQQSILIPQNAVVATISDATVPALTFVTQGQALLNVSNLTSFYNTQYGWWGVDVPAQCASAGSATSVGSGSIAQVVSNVPSGMNVTNLVSARFGTDSESNAHFAARIQARNVTGVDTGTRHGYLVTALSTPGIVGAQVVAAGDVEMVRDWDPIRQKHVFGCVDVYTRGTTASQQDETAFFQYRSAGTYGQASTYIPLNPVSGMKFQIAGFGGLPFPLYDAVELQVSRLGSSFYLGLDRAQFDNVNGDIVLNATDMAYQYLGGSVSQVKAPLVLNGNPATNSAVVSALSSATTGTYSFALFARYKSPFVLVPSLQPVTSILSIAGQSGLTGVVSSAVTQLIHTSDFLLDGGSNDAGDIVQVNIASQPATSTVTALLAQPAVIDTAMDVPVDANGNPLGVLSVRSTDSSTLYQNGIDYGIVPTGAYRTYGLRVLVSSVLISAVSVLNNVATITANNEFGVGAPISFSGLLNATFLNGQTLPVAAATPTAFTVAFTTPNQSTAGDTGLASGSAIQNNQSVVVGYNKFVLYERLSFAPAEPQVLNGTLPTTLDNQGFVNNVWLPQSYSAGIPSFPFASGSVNATYLALVYDGWNGQYALDGSLDVAGSALATQALSGTTVLGYTGLIGAQVPYNSRYVKVTYYNGTANIVKKEGIDFALGVDPISGTATVSRIITGTIPDGGTVLVSYFYLEPFDFSTQYPAAVQILVKQLAATKHAAADVLVKAMVANPVDITMAVTLNSNTSAEAIDPTIRTIINIVLDNAINTLHQSELVAQVQSITGVQSVQLPLLKCAKSDASYDIGVVVPTGTAWVPLKSDPAFAKLNVPSNSWITALPVLPDSTLPSGGQDNAIVDFLYEGQVFRRAASVQDFLGNSTSPAHIASIATPGSFYIVGTNDSIGPAAPLGNAYAQRVLLVVPQDVVNPGNLSYLVTYQVFGEGGATDITVSSTEFLSPGRITINYLTAS